LTPRWIGNSLPRTDLSSFATSAGEIGSVVVA
jgi:hypothetical protein